ncbi:MAG: hypothetical protein MJZ41_11570 [Bacteroidaceae bacterium]|nr:hypothetical protein [Bacteroidaceae bacterium]
MIIKNFIYKLFTLICVVQLMFVQTAKAQFARLDKYPDIPTQYDAAFVDHVKNFASGVAKTSYGQYFGQITKEKNVYGFGAYYTDQDGIIYGQYRLGNFLFGIKMGTQTAKVGTNDHYICYDLTTGDPVYIFKNGDKYKLPADYSATYRFESLTYQNGDKYVGETVKGKREGLGIYYYSNGDYYYGKYKDNVQRGYGALFFTDNTMKIQYWKGEDE